MKQTICSILVATAPLLAQVLTINQNPSREFGQPTLTNPQVSAAPNLVEGRELYSPSGIAFDNSVTPPHVYVTDTGNNRVLAWSNANNVTQGNYADLVLGQTASSVQLALTSTLTGGPNAAGSNSSTGLISPTGLAVDSSGNVYVADSGNNRILRFRAPYKQPAGDLVVDLVIGQKNLLSGGANQGQANPGAGTLYLNVASTSTGFLPAGLAFDASGDLWVADVGNNRVLRFPASSLSSNGPSADTVLGQTTFTSNQFPSQPTQTGLSYVVKPTGISLDSAGNVYVADSYGRVLVYSSSSIAIGATASKVLGLPPTPASQSQVVTYPTSSTLGATSSSGTTITGAPQGVFVLNGGQGPYLFVCDSPQSRIVVYTNPIAATVQSPANSPIQSSQIGQPSSTSGQVNQGFTTPTNQTFSFPVAGAIRADNQEMWIVDQGNHRVVAFSNQGGPVYSSASRVLGQTDFIYDTANLIVGSEIWVSGFGAGLAIDKTSCSSTQPVSCTAAPHLYIADANNNRILGFKDARLVGVDSRTLLTQKADLVIGQTDLLHSIVNSPGGVATQPTATGLNQPVGLAVDANGNLWVADTGNGRVLRFPAPFAQPANVPQTANVVLGQPDFMTYAPGVSQFSMSQPFGLAIFSNGSLAVSEPQNNRVLVFNKPSGDFLSTGSQASLVIGQAGFSQTGSSSGNSGFNSPRHIAVDSSDRLYVCDSSNSRLMIFSKPSSNNPSAVLQVPGLNAPQGIIVSSLTGLSWVASAGNNTVYQLPEFLTLGSTLTPTQYFAVAGPLAVALDPFDNVIVADSTNRVSFFFGQLYYRNTASYSAGLGTGSNAGPTPTMLAFLSRWGSPFNFTQSWTGTDTNLSPPWPLTLNNIQVTVNGLPAPIFRIETNQVYIEIPNNAPTSGTADFVVSDPTTGQIFAAATYAMQAASPGLYTLNAAGYGAAVASVYDSKGSYLGVNSTTLPAAAGTVVTLWLTGAGNVPGLPADGIAPNGAFFTPTAPTVYIAGQPATVVGSVMSPQFPGLWQINVVVPPNTPPSSAVGPNTLVVFMNDYNSNVGGTNGTNGNPGADRALLSNANGGNGLITTIYTK